MKQMKEEKKNITKKMKEVNNISVGDKAYFFCVKNEWGAYNEKRSFFMDRVLIGNTPLVKIKVEYLGKFKNVYAKLEYYNYTGSIKDRMAKYILDSAYNSGEIKKGTPIIEATSGNTGVSFSALGTLYGNPVHIFMPDWASIERRKIMEMYGAKVYLVSREEGGFAECIFRANHLAKLLKGYRPQQFSNTLNKEAHYKSTGKEIVDANIPLDAFVCGFGTGGTLMGVAQRLKENYPNISIYALEPDSMTLLSTTQVYGTHRIEGIGDDFLPDLIDKDLIDDIITVSDGEAIHMAKRLSRELGLGVGISSGANFLGAVLSPKDNIVTIFADDFKKYLSTDLFKENEQETYISDSIKILSMEIV